MESLETKTNALLPVRLTAKPLGRAQVVNTLLAERYIAFHNYT